jgi:hypothetical protein
MKNSGQDFCTSQLVNRSFVQVPDSSNGEAAPHLVKKNSSDIIVTEGFEKYSSLFDS